MARTSSRPQETSILGNLVTSRLEGNPLCSLRWERRGEVGGRYGTTRTNSIVIMSVSVVSNGVVVALGSYAMFTLELRCGRARLATESEVHRPKLKRRCRVSEPAWPT